MGTDGWRSGWDGMGIGVGFGTGAGIGSSVSMGEATHLPPARTLSVSVSAATLARECIPAGAREHVEDNADADEEVKTDVEVDADVESRVSAGAPESTCGDNVRCAWVWSWSWHKESWPGWPWYCAKATDAVAATATRFDASHSSTSTGCVFTLPPHTPAAPPRGRARSHGAVRRRPGARADSRTVVVVVGGEGRGVESAGGMVIGVGRVWDGALLGDAVAVGRVIGDGVLEVGGVGREDGVARVFGDGDGVVRVAGKVHVPMVGIPVGSGDVRLPEAAVVMAPVKEEKGAEAEVLDGRHRERDGQERSDVVVGRYKKQEIVHGQAHIQVGDSLSENENVANGVQQLRREASVSQTALIYHGHVWLQFNMVSTLVIA
ncbi:hypothetical protein BDZ97DRAFT_1752718 [Flammula alnicola]|nr:hypothetical protein BDZ97DRAFT_1752718 [Flammula alnicola]